MNGESSEPGGDDAEEDNEGDVPSNARAVPVYGYGEVNDGARSCLSDHVYPNPPVSFD